MFKDLCLKSYIGGFHVPSHRFRTYLSFEQFFRVSRYLKSCSLFPSFVREPGLSSLIITIVLFSFSLLQSGDKRRYASCGRINFWNIFRPFLAIVCFASIWVFLDHWPQLLCLSLESYTSNVLIMYKPTRNFDIVVQNCVHLLFSIGGRAFPKTIW